MAKDNDFILAAAERVRNAAAAGGSLRIRGGGSKDFYGEALEGELLDTAPLNACRLSRHTLTLARPRHPWVVVLYLAAPP